MKSNSIWLAAACLIVIGASATVITKTMSAGQKTNAPLHRFIGELLAQETLHCLNGRGEVLVITLADRNSEVLSTQLAAFQTRLKSSGVRIKDIVVIDNEKKANCGPGLGLSANKLLRELKKHGKKDAVVSFVGLPKVEESESAALEKPVPALLTFSRDAEKLAPLFKRGFVKAAIVPRFQFPSPSPEVPRTAGDWFTNQYQLVRADSTFGGK